MPLAKIDATWDDYREHLQMLFAWLTPIDNWLAGFSNGPQGKQAPSIIRYSDIILQDLGDSLEIPQQNMTWASSENAAYRWGVCYVVEGSQLGGEFLYKRLAQRLSPHKLTYLQRKEPGRWPAFLQCMATELTTQDTIDKACAGARDAFDALLKQFPQRDTPHE